MAHLVRLIVAVADDLWSFTYDGVRSIFPKPEAPLEQLSLPHMPLVEIPEETLTKSLRALAVRPQVALATSAPTQNTVMYIGVPYAHLSTNPSGGESSASVPYGAMVMVLEASGASVRIASGKVEGWVAATDLADRAAAVYPQFVIGEKNLSNTENTARVRAMIEDEFGAGEHYLPLQAEEYALYKLARRGIRVMWPRVRPRTPGTWHTLLKGQHAVRINGTPAQGALIEYQLIGDQKGGHVAYVEAVFPDESIQISEANWPEDGIYNERVMVKQEWEELSPHFLIF